MFGLLVGFFAGNIFPLRRGCACQQARVCVGWLNFFGSLLSGFAPLLGGLWKKAIGLEGLLSATAVAYVIAAACLSVGIHKWYQRDFERVH